MKRPVSALTAVLLLVAGTGHAQDAPSSWGRSVAVRPADDAAVRDVITRQLDAFVEGDRAGAYAATAPNVRRKFPTAAGFGAMAGSHYAPLFQVARHAFAALRGGAATATQAETWSQDVEIVTRDGARWSAVYGLERQPDGTIAITSCVLTPRADTSS